MSNSSIWPIDRTLSSATTSGQSGPESDGNERVLWIPQSSSITGASASDCSVSYPGHSLGMGLTSQQRCSQCILRPQLTGPINLSINIMSCYQHRSPLPSLTTYLYHPLLLRGIQSYILYWVRAVVYRSEWSSCLCSSMWWGSQEYVAYEFVLTSPAVSCMSGSSNLVSFHDGW